MSGHSQLRHLISQSAETRERVETQAQEGNERPATSTAEVRGWTSSRWRRIIWFVAVMAGLAQTIAYRHEVNPDGISYLDIARNCEQGHWRALVNAYWSPLYPLLMGTVFRMFKPTPYWESTVAHFVDFAIFLCCFAAFEFLLAGLIQFQRSRGDDALGISSLPEWVMWALGDSIFVYLTLLLIQLAWLVPDLCVAAFFYLACGIMLRIQAGRHRWPAYVALGVVLGTGYLAKAFMFPLSWLFLACCFITPKPLSRAIPRAGLALAAFLLIAAPYIRALSVAKGRLTFGDVGKINYAEFVNGVTRSVHWQGGPDNLGEPVHPTRQLMVSPALFEFGAPVGGTYPPWYDPSYWYDGVAPRFVLRNQLQAIRYTIEEYASILPYTACLLTGFLGLLLCAKNASFTAIAALENWPILTVAGAGLALFGLVYIESRYVVPFFVVLWVGLFGDLRFERRLYLGRIVRGAAIAIVFTLGTGVIWLFGRASFSAFKLQPFVDWEVAEGLRGRGLRPGDRVGSIGYSFGAYWAHLAGVKIVAEVPLGAAPSFWAASPAIQQNVFEAIAHAGAKVVVTDERPPADSPGWEEIRPTGYYVHNLMATVSRDSPDANRPSETK